MNSHSVCQGSYWVVSNEGNRKYEHITMHFLVLKGQEELKLEGVLYLERICSDTLSAAVSDIDLLLRDGIIYNIILVWVIKLQFIILQVLYFRI